MSSTPDPHPAVRAPSFAGASTSAAFAGRYRYVGELGSGASARVIAVHDDVTGTACAAKVLDAQAGSRAVWELETLRRVASPHLVRALELLRVEDALAPPFATPKGAWFLSLIHI